MTKKAKWPDASKPCPCGIGPNVHEHARPANNHTPGPWTLGRRLDFHREITTVGGEYIAQVPKDFQGDANARLIAAAPDLLAALKVLEEELNQAPSCRDVRHINGTCPVCRARNVARAAIGKATGEAA